MKGKKLRKVGCVIGILLLVIGICLCTSCIARNIRLEESYAQWQESLADASQTPMFAYSRSGDMEYFAYEAADGVSACGQRNMTTGEEILYRDGYSFTFSGDLAEPVCQAADSAKEIARIRASIVAEVSAFSEERIVGKRLHQQKWLDGSLPYYCVDPDRTVFFELRDARPGEYAQASVSENGESAFVYNIDVQAPDTAASCILLQLGWCRGTDGLWQGHDWLELSYDG